MELLILIVAFLLLLTAGMSVSFSMGLLGVAGMFLAGGFSNLDPVGIVAWATTNSFLLTAIPLFIFMGEIILRAGFGKELFDAAAAFFGKMRGGLGMATIVAAGVFSAVSGSSAAACATIGLVAIPEMERYKYDRRLIYGTMTSGGSLDILIPPSVIMIVYGSFTEQSIGKLYLAGFIPGFILAFFFIVVIWAWARMDPKAAPLQAWVMSWRERVRVLMRVWTFALLMILCLGTIFVGIATPTEAAALGAVGSLVMALIRRKITWQDFKRSLLGTAEVTCMVMFLILGGLILSNYLLQQDIPARIMNFTFSLGLPHWAVLALIYFIYFIMGCLIDGLSMMIITLPLVIPIIKAMGFDLIWFGVIMVVLVELSQLTPPVGMNLYIIRNVSGGKIEDVIMGSLPFTLAIIAALILFTLFPSLSLWLPRWAM
jgi:tripartite ATP-independent transporter DctM subunit